jgi:broad specificity phosphatase PhoE
MIQLQSNKRVMKDILKKNILRQSIDARVHMSISIFCSRSTGTLFYSTTTTSSFVIDTTGKTSNSSSSNLILKQNQKHQTYQTQHQHKLSTKSSSHPSTTATTTAATQPLSSPSSSYNLCFLRHGQSTWNYSNLFIGWTDTPLTPSGTLEARLAGQILSKSSFHFDEVHTSLLKRSIQTTNLVLMELQQEYIPIYKSWRLNERHYGDLVGKNKKEVVKMFGKDQVKEWRRSWDVKPPEMKDDHQWNPVNDLRYRDVSAVYAVQLLVTAVFHLLKLRTYSLSLYLYRWYIKYPNVKV